ncbi:MAG: ribosome silencing factor [Oscillospiraceae bacterium]|nr:ribosome silencing factor [Oscillospiraceae bacterium]
MTGLEIAKKAAKILDEKLGTDVKLLKVDAVTVIADYFVIVSGQSNIQVSALADEVEYQLSQHQVIPTRKEGTPTGGWVVLDYLTVIIHIFHSESREFYSLERLWADAKQIDID